MIMLNQEEKGFLRQKQLMILSEFDKVCKMLCLHYTLTAGSLLGAVRHRGYIPWDDDIDVAMLREDYEKFLAYGQNYLPKNLFIQTYKTDPGYNNFYAKIRDVSTVFVEWGERNSLCKKGIYIDIFPIDAVPRKKIIRIIQTLILNFLLNLNYIYYGYEDIKTSNINLMNRAKALFLFVLSRIVGINLINDIIIWVKTKYNRILDNIKTDSDMILSPGYISRRIDDEKLLNLYIYKSTEYIEFENMLVMCIKEKENYLKKKYGDYMNLPPINQRVSPHRIFRFNISRSDSL